MIDVDLDVDNSAIRIDFNDLSLENRYDFLYYGVGTDASNLTAALGRYTGNGELEPLLIEGGAVWLRFVSDVAVNQRGFDLTWTRTSPQGKKKGWCELVLYR